MGKKRWDMNPLKKITLDRRTDPGWRPESTVNSIKPKETTEEDRELVRKLVEAAGFSQEQFKPPAAALTDVQVKLMERARETAVAEREARQKQKDEFMRSMVAHKKEVMAKMSERLLEEAKNLSPRSDDPSDQTGPQGDMHFGLRIDALLRELGTLMGRALPVEECIDELCIFYSRTNDLDVSTRTARVDISYDLSRAPAATSTEDVPSPPVPEKKRRKAMPVLRSEDA